MLAIFRNLIQHSLDNADDSLIWFNIKKLLSNS